MDLLSVSLIGCSLAMDAFAVSICLGVSQRHVRLWPMIKIGLFFGGAQFIMPVAGFFIGQAFLIYIKSVAHWIAFLLLAFIGFKMIADARKSCENDPSLENAGTGRLFLLALATSIDALTVGISLGMLGGQIILSAGVIGVITFTISCAGVLLGKTLGGRFQQKAQIGGGVVLVLLGARIVIEHLL